MKTDFDTILERAGLLKEENNPTQNIKYVYVVTSNFSYDSDDKLETEIVRAFSTYEKAKAYCDSNSPGDGYWDIEQVYLDYDSV